MARSSERSNFGGSESLELTLLKVVLVLVVTILAAGAYLVFYVVSHEGMPSSYQDKVVQDTRAGYLVTMQDPAAAARYIRALTATGEYSKARQIVDEFRSAESTSPPAAVTIEEARLEYELNNPEEALAVLDTADDECQQLFELRSSEYRKKGVFIEPDMPEVVEAQLLRAEVLVALDRTDDAVASLSIALEKDPTMADVRVKRASLLATLGRIDEARTDYNRALQMLPDYAPALEGLEALGD